MKRLSLPWGEALMRAMTRRSADQVLAAQANSPKRRTWSASPWTRLTAASSARSAILVSRTWFAGEAEDVADPVALAPGHGFGPGVVAVAADEDLDPGPAAANRFHDMPHDQGDLGARRRLARPEDHRDRPACGRLVDVNWQEAAAIVMGVEQRELLAAVNPILGIVDIEHDPLRQLSEAVADRSAALSGSRPTAILKTGSTRSASQSLASS
jgi:hypothetical protein